MDTIKNAGRKNFKCIFNDYITTDNRDSVVQSIISQFQGYFANPEVTIIDRGFVLSLDLSPDLTDVMVRDKILWNRYVERVTTQDAIRKIQIIRLPQAGLMDFGGRIKGQGSVGGFGPDVDPVVGDTGVSEKLYTQQDHPAKYKIDGGADPKTLGETASVHYADKTDMSSEGQAFVQGLTPDGLSSDATELVTGPNDELATGKRVMGFRVISSSQGEGSAFTENTDNSYGIPLDPAKSLLGTNEDEAFVGPGSFFNTDDERGTMTGVEFERRGEEAVSAPLMFSANKADEPVVEDEESAAALPQARGGGQSVPDGGQVEGWYASNFGLNETYDYLGDQDDYEF